MVLSVFFLYQAAAALLFAQSPADSAFTRAPGKRLTASCSETPRCCFRNLQAAVLEFMKSAVSVDRVAAFRTFLLKMADLFDGTTSALVHMSGQRLMIQLGVTTTMNGYLASFVRQNTSEQFGLDAQEWIEDFGYTLLTNDKNRPDIVKQSRALADRIAFYLEKYYVKEMQKYQLSRPCTFHSVSEVHSWPELDLLQRIGEATCTENIVDKNLLQDFNKMKNRYPEEQQKSIGEQLEFMKIAKTKSPEKAQTTTPSPNPEITTIRTTRPPEDTRGPFVRFFVNLWKKIVAFFSRK